MSKKDATKKEAVKTPTMRVMNSLQYTPSKGEYNCGEDRTAPDQSIPIEVLLRDHTIQNGTFMPVYYGDIEVPQPRAMSLQELHELKQRLKETVEEYEAEAEMAKRDSELAQQKAIARATNNGSDEPTGEGGTGAQTETHTK